MNLSAIRDVALNYWVSIAVVALLGLGLLLLVMSHQSDNRWRAAQATAQAAFERHLHAVEVQALRVNARGLAPQVEMDRQAEQENARMARQAAKRRAAARSTAAIQTTIQPVAAPQLTQPHDVTGAGSNPHATSGTPYANCVDTSTCPLTIARARSVATWFAAKVASGQPSGVTSCSQQSPSAVICGYWINATTQGITCHYVGATVEIIQPTYQRALEYINTSPGACD